MRFNHRHRKVLHIGGRGGGKGEDNGGGGGRLRILGEGQRGN